MTVQPILTDDDKPGPSTQHAAFREMSELAKLPRLLRRGTRAMRKSQEWTPKSPGESDDGYALRLKRSFLLGKYEDVCEAAGDSMFSGELIVEPPAVAEEQAPESKPGEKPKPEAEPAEPSKPELDDEPKAWLEDFDGEGRTAEDWLMDAFQEALDVGCVHCLTDHPRIPAASSLEEEQATGAKPYAVMIRGDDVLQAVERREGGRQRLVRFNFRICEAVTDGWGEKRVERTMVLYAGDALIADLGPESLRWARWEVYDKDDKGKDLPNPTDKGSMRPHIDIPLDTLYTKRTGFLRSKPALNRLAEKNAEHWQSSSHQRFNLDFSRFPQQFRKGFSDEPGKKATKVGASIIHEGKDEWSDMKIVETTGASLGAGRQHLEDCKTEMAEMALEPFLKAGPSTAAEVAVEKGEADTKLEAWAIGVGRFVTAILGRMRRWTTPADQEPKPVGVARLRMDKTLVMTPAQLELLKFLRGNGDIDQQTLLRALKENGLLPVWLDIARVIDSTKSETPKLLGFPLPLPGGQAPPMPPKREEQGEPAA